ncbi:MAG: hypothetical protein P1P88_00730 [Bacteroidales bacterium]|nr:hypothetical protein [Bacteroidales bacterium]
MRSRLKLIKSTLILSVFLSFPYVLNAQKEEFRLDESYSNIKWNDFVNKVETNYPVRFFYDQDSLSNFQVLIPERTTSFSELLNTILKPYHFKAFIGNNGNIIVTNNTAFLSNIPESFYLGES